MINIKVVKRINARDKSAPALYYGCVKAFGRVSVDQMAKRIAANCTVTRSDCLAVLSALQEQSIQALLSGATVSLGDLGSLRLTCRSGAVEAPEHFECTDIKSLRVVFTPGTTLREAFKLTNKEVQLNNLYKEGLRTNDELEAIATAEAA